MKKKKKKLTSSNTSGNIFEPIWCGSRVEGNAGKEYFYFYGKINTDLENLNFYRYRRAYSGTKIYKESPYSRANTNQHRPIRALETHDSSHIILPALYLADEIYIIDTTQKEFYREEYIVQKNKLQFVCQRFFDLYDVVGMASRKVVEKKRKPYKKRKVKK